MDLSAPLGEQRYDATGGQAAQQVRKVDPTPARTAAERHDPGAGEGPGRRGPGPGVGHDRLGRRAVPHDPGRGRGPSAAVDDDPDRVVPLPTAGQAGRQLRVVGQDRADPDQDRAAAEELVASAKDRAENVMIVDLLRNDLSRVCRPGSVHVPELLALESHPTVHHLVSTVEGELQEGCGPVDLLRATLPGGSITGAPKIRAREVLRELEPVRRGVYTGALGVIERSGAMELSIAIRTATLSGGEMHYGAGGGITLDSEAWSEWLETLDKARPFLQVATGDAP